VVNSSIKVNIQFQSLSYASQANVGFLVWSTTKSTVFLISVFKVDLRRFYLHYQDQFILRRWLFVYTFTQHVLTSLVSIPSTQACLNKSAATPAPLTKHYKDFVYLGTVPDIT